MRQRPPKSTRTCTLCPYTTLFLSAARCRLPLPLASESIGVVVLQHVAAPGRSRRELFEECARVLAPGGRLWVFALNPLAPYRWRWRGTGLGASEDRTIVVKGKSVSIRVDLGGRRTITQKSTHNQNL